MISGAEALSSSAVLTLPDPSGPAWYVLRTKPRQEKRAQDNLKAWKLETLLPLLPERRKNPRPTDAIRALFPSYIFCRFPARLFDKVKYTYGISYVVSFGGVPAQVDESIIEGLQQRMDARGSVVMTPTLELTKGDQVIIQSGAFAGMLGVFENEISGGERVRILLNTMRLRSTVELERQEIRKVTE